MLIWVYVLATIYAYMLFRYLVHKQEMLTSKHIQVPELDINKPALNCKFWALKNKNGIAFRLYVDENCEPHNWFGATVDRSMRIQLRQRVTSLDIYSSNLMLLEHIKTAETLHSQLPKVQIME